jgi:hypothetical protein
MTVHKLLEEKSIICKRMLSLRGGSKNLPLEWPQWVNQAHTAIFFQLLVQTSSIVYPVIE